MLFVVQEGVHKNKPETLSSGKIFREVVSKPVMTIESWFSEKDYLTYELEAKSLNLTNLSTAK